MFWHRQQRAGGSATIACGRQDYVSEWSDVRAGAGMRHRIIPESVPSSMPSALPVRKPLLKPP